MTERHDAFPWSAMPFSAVSLVMFGLSYHESRRAKQLKQAHSVSSVSEALGLAELLPILIAVQGKTASDNPLQTKITSSPAVMIEDTSEWSALKQNEKGVWLPDSEIFRHHRNESDWFITDDGKSRLSVKSCANATHLEKTLVTSKQFIEGETSTYKKVINRLSGYQPLGVWQTEKSLPVDTTVTVVGELAKSEKGDGSMLVKQPSNLFKGRPFYITNQTFEELHESIMRNIGTYKWLGIGFGTVSLILMGINLWKHVRSNIHYRRIRKQIADETQRRQTGQIENEEDRPIPGYLDLGHRGKCIVCWEHDADAVFIPCGHVCGCMTCCEDLKKCPVCRTPCSVHKIYIA